MESFPRLTDWLETHWVAPAFGGGILAFFAICFFGAATNTMAGWLYALSGVIIALLGLGAVLPARTLRHLRLYRHPIAPVTAGEELAVQIEVQNHSSQPKSWLEVRDRVPSVLASPQATVLEGIPPRGSHSWTYYLPTQQRGIYHWQDFDLRTGSPLGLFWCRRSQSVPCRGVVYPQILSLRQCPLVDSFGRDESIQQLSDRCYQSATQGVTKALRDYRLGDPTRLIHWRTSARFGEFKVRELETITGGEEISIVLDNSLAWRRDRFEAAVTIAASLYFYARRCQLKAKLWTAGTGIIQGNRPVLEALAAVEPEERSPSSELPIQPAIWITPSRDRLRSLVTGSRWVLLPTEAGAAISSLRSMPQRGLTIERDRDLQTQLQSPLR